MEASAGPTFLADPNVQGCDIFWKLTLGSLFESTEYGAEVSIQKTLASIDATWALCRHMWEIIMRWMRFIGGFSTYYIYPTANFPSFRGWFRV